MIKKLLIVSATLNFIIIFSAAFAIKKVGGLKYLMIRLERTVSTDHEDMVSHFRLLPDIDNEIVMLGNSMTFHGQWAELFQNDKIINRGIGGDDSDRILSRIDEIAKRKPAKVFMMIGINDLGKGNSIDYIMENYRKTVDALKKESPTTKLYLQSVLPINNEIRNHRRSNSDIKILNEKIEALAVEKNETYIDLFSKFIAEDGYLSRKLTSDGVHINGEGYVLWKEIIGDMVKETAIAEVTTGKTD